MAVDLGLLATGVAGGGRRPLDFSLPLPGSPGKLHSGGKLRDKLTVSGTPKVTGLTKVHPRQVEGRGHQKRLKGPRRGFWLQVLRRAMG